MALLTYPITAGVDRLVSVTVYEYPGATTIVGPSLVLLYLLGLLALLVSLGNRPSRGSPASPRLALGLLAWGLVVTVASPNASRGLLFIAVGSLLLDTLWFLAARRASHTVSAARTICWGLVISVLVPVLFRMARDFFRGGSVVGASYNRSLIAVYAYGPVVHYSQALVMVIPVCIGLALAAKSRFARRAAVATGLILTAELLLTDTRGAFVALFVALLLFVYRSPALRRRAVRAALWMVPLLALFAGHAIAEALRSRALIGTGDVSGTQRLTFMLLFLGALQQSSFTQILFGRGVTGQFFLTDLTPGAHNSWLSVLADLGLVGLALLGGLTYVALRASGQRDRRGEPLLAGCAAGVTSWVVHSVTTGNEFLYHIAPVINMQLFVLMALCAASAHWAAPASEPSKLATDQEP